MYCNLKKYIKLTAKNELICLSRTMFLNCDTFFINKIPLWPWFNGSHCFWFIFHTADCHKRDWRNGFRQMPPKSNFTYRLMALINVNLIFYINFGPILSKPTSINNQRPYHYIKIVEKNGNNPGQKLPIRFFLVDCGKFLGWSQKCLKSRNI